MEGHRIPNVLVLGTPGSGKSTLCRKVLERIKDSEDTKDAETTTITHINIAELIKEKNLATEWDNEMDCSVYDEDLLKEELESYDFKKGGLLVEFHGSEFFENSQFDRVYVLLTSLSVLHSRLSSRGYSEEKIKENLQCETFQTCLYDSYEVFDRDKVVQLDSNDESDLDRNVETLVKFLLPDRCTT